MNGNGGNRLVVLATGAAANWGNFETGYLASIADITALHDGDGDLTHSAATPANTTTLSGSGTTYTVVDIQTLAGRTTSLSHLLASTSYEIHVYEYTLAGNVPSFNLTEPVNNPRTITTLQNALAAPASVTGLAADITSEGGKITWTDATNIDGYYIDVYDVATGAYVYDNADIGLPTGVDAEKYWLFGLTKSTAYRVVMRSYKNGKTSANSNIVDITTKATPNATGGGAITYTPSSTTRKIGETIIVVVNPVPLQPGLQLDPASTVNGSTNITMVESADGVYTVTYTVQALDNTSLDGNNFPISIILNDGETIPVSSPAITGGVNNASAPGVDATRPTIVSIAPTATDGGANGPHKYAATVPLLVTFSEAVTITDGPSSAKPRIALTGFSSPGSHYAIYSGDGTSSSTHTFTYTVGTDDESTDMTINGAGSNGVIDLNTATIQDAVLNDLNVFSLNRTGTNFANANEIVVDGKKPTLTDLKVFIDANGDGAYVALDGDKLLNTTTNILNEADIASGDRLVVLATFDESMANGTPPTIGFTTNPLTNSTFTIDAGNTGWVGAGPTYTVYKWEYTLADHNTDYTAVDVDVTLATDLATNAMNAFSAVDKFSIDLVAPADAIISSVTTVGGTVKAGYWNASNTDLTIVVPVANDASLDGGTIQLQASRDDFSTPLALDAAHTIVANDRTTTTYTFTVSEATFQGLASFADGDVWKFRAVMTDKVGNTTNSTAAATTITVDQTLPAAFDITSASATGVTPIANYWNSTNTGFTSRVVIDVAGTDATLLNGNVLLQYQKNSAGPWTDFTAAHIIDGSDRTAHFYDVAAAFDDAGFANGDVISFQAIISDVAGNAKTSNAFATTFTVDQAIPTLNPVTIASSNAITSAANTGQDVTLSFTSSKDIVANPTVSFSSGGSTVTNNGAITYTGATTAWTAKYTTNTSDVEGPVTFTINFTDTHGNPGVPVTALTSGPTVVFDKPAPVIAIISDNGATYKKNGQTVTITFYLTEDNPVTNDPVVEILN